MQHFLLFLDFLSAREIEETSIFLTTSSSAYDLVMLISDPRSVHIDSLKSSKVCFCLCLLWVTLAIARVMQSGTALFFAPKQLCPQISACMQ